MKLYAVFGNPIAHSKSPYLHNFAFEKLNIDARYVRFKLENASNFRELFFEMGLSGANITIPFKEILLETCDEVVGIAQKIGAINTIVRRGNRLLGHNTDALGFYQNIKGDKLKTALIIGAGGSARAIAVILQERGIKVSVINRSPKRLDFFRKMGFKCAEFGEFYGRFACKSSVNRADFVANRVDSWANRNHLGANRSANPQYDLIINATSSSINDELPLDSAVLGELFSGAKIAFDLMYGKKCPFLELAKTRGGGKSGGKKRAIRTIDGANMLLYQAIYASSLFLDKPYHTIAKAMSPAFK